MGLFGGLRLFPDVWSENDVLFQRLMIIIQIHQYYMYIMVLSHTQLVNIVIKTTISKQGKHSHKTFSSTTSSFNQWVTISLIDKNYMYM